MAGSAADPGGLLHEKVRHRDFTVAKWYDYINEPTIADAIMDRLTAGDVHRIELKGESLRRKNKNNLTLQNLIATTSEVAHYIASQAVHYNPLQEVHSSRYWQIIL